MLKHLIAVSVVVSFAASARAAGPELPAINAATVRGTPFYTGYTVTPREPKIPQYAKDAFKDLRECSVADALFIRQPSLKEAVDMLEPCMKAVSKRYGVTVSVKEGKMPDSADPGIGIFVRGELMIGNPVLMDLDYSIKLRRGGLFGHKAYVDYRK